MRFNIFKNTVLSIITGAVLVMISCANLSKKKEGGKFKEGAVLLTDELSEAHSYPINEKKALSVGANLTKAYLPLLNGKRVGIVANQTSVIFKAQIQGVGGVNYTHLVDSLLTLKVDIKKVFAPEHGFRGHANAGEEVKDGIDTKTNLPIISLYGKNKKPSASQLENIDIIVFDIQDVGARFYTYISTLHYVMEACAENNIPVVVLDRPNPNGHYIDGPVLETEHKSFVGMHPVPVVHGLTIGEYAKMINGEKWLTNGLMCHLQVIDMKNYNHELSYSLPIKPSPNLPNDKSINLYPSLCFFEGTNVNAGRGSNMQFQVFGSPFLNAKYYNFKYMPKSNSGAKHPKHENKWCFGTDLTQVEDLRRLNINWLIEAYNNTLNKDEFFNAFFTKLAGTKKLQKQIEAGLNESDIKATWQTDLIAFKKMRSNYLIYN